MTSRMKHGQYSNGVEQPTHYVWRTMVARCTRITAKDYQRYGGRGISICERWLDFANFLEDMGVRPDGLSLDRIDNNGNYEPDNCRWATRSQQQKNKRTTQLYIREHDGFTGTLVEVANMLGIGKELAYWRFKSWATFEKGIVWQKLQKGL